MKNKVALITGGSKGIGYGIAESMLEQGIKVAITSRSQDSADAAVAALKKKYPDGDVIGIASDVTSLDEEYATVDQVIDKYGQLDYLIANAGVGHFAPIDEMTDEHWHQTIDTNLTGVFHSVKAAVEEIKKTKGYIITIASLAGTNFFAQGAAYNASKFGLVGMTQAIMLDLRPYEVKISTIMPGSVSTHFNGNEPADKDAWKIQPEDIGELVVDLIKMNPRTLPSKIEVRPSQTAKK